MKPFESSLEYVRDAMQSLPQHLQDALAVPLPTFSSRPTSLIATGIGASEGPARILVHALAARGLAARFCPISQLGASEVRAEWLVVFSQGLSPNAQLAHHAADHFSQRWLVSSVLPSKSREAKCDVLGQFTEKGFKPLVIPPNSEPQTLVRMMGPTVAALVALRLAAHLSGDDELRECLLEAPAAYGGKVANELFDASRLGIVTAGFAVEQVFAHRWKLLEALLESDPPVWDVLQFAHGPLQAFHGKKLSLLVLERGGGSPLLSRLRKTLSGTQHQIIHVSTRRTNELAFFEVAFAIDALVLQMLSAQPRDLFSWPAKHGDAPLYGFGGEGSP